MTKRRSDAHLSQIGQGAFRAAKVHIEAALRAVVVHQKTEARPNVDFRRLNLLNTHRKRQRCCIQSTASYEQVS